MKSLVVNFFGAPGASKSTFAYGIMHKLKCAGIECEFAAEYAKDVVFEESPKKLNNQIYIFGKQLHRMIRLSGKVKVIVSDSPLLFSVIYDVNNQETFHKLILEEHNKFDNLNILLQRVHEYNPNGRLQTEEGSNKIHDKIKNLLDKNSIKYHTFNSYPENLNKIFSFIQEKINFNSDINHMQDTLFHALKIPKELFSEGKEPTEQEITDYMVKSNRDYYNAREDLRGLAYGGYVGAKPPGGFENWGDYWKSY